MNRSAYARGLALVPLIPGLLALAASFMIWSCDGLQIVDQTGGRGVSPLATSSRALPTSTVTNPLASPVGGDIGPQPWAGTVAPGDVDQPGTVAAATSNGPQPGLEPSAALAPSVATEPREGLPIPIQTYTVVKIYPHDREAYTQGLVLDRGVLYEGTGREGQSSLRRVDLETGKVLQLRRLADQFFGEGIAVVDERIVQLTWKSNIGFVYDRHSFEQLDTFAYPTEGWGITYDGQRLIVSDGTALLRFLDPDTYVQVGEILVHDGMNPVTRLNELEYVAGEVYANVYQTDHVARIDPQTGRVVGWIDLRGLLDLEDYRAPVPPDVLNGIAYDVENDRLFVTGKLWPKLFEIKLRSAAELLP